MPGPTHLPFEYLLRGSQLEDLHGTMLAQAIEQRDAELEDFLGHVSYTAWLPFPVANGYTAYDAPGPGARVPQIRRLGNEAFCRGVLKVPVVPATIFGQLSVGWRPGIANQSMPGNVDDTAQMLIVNSAGNVGTTGTYTPTAYVFLDSLHWTIGG